MMKLNQNCMMLIGGGMIGNSNYIGTCLNGLPTSTKNPSKMPYSVSSTKFFKDKNIKTSHWVGQSELK